MMMLRVLQIFLIMVATVSCDTKNPRNVDKTDLFPDSLFALKEISDTGFRDKIEWRDNQVYVGSKKLTKLDSSMVIKLFESPYEAQYRKFYLFSKQKKEKEYQPIVFFVVGDDYSALTLLTIDSLGHPIDKINIDGGYWGGPTEIGDSLLLSMEPTFSKLEKNQIIMSRSTYYERINETDSFFVDSVVYKSRIDPKGKITTTMIDSLRLEKTASATH